MALATVNASDQAALRFRLPFWPKTPGRNAPRLPDGLRVYAIGDVHGCLGQLNKLLNVISEELARRPARARLVFLGDLVDRGPDTAGVIERVMGELPGEAATFLIGNHEEVMVACYDGDYALCQKWLQYGGMQTLESYGLSRAEIFDNSNDLPAGMRPGRALEAQESVDLR